MTILQFPQRLTDELRLAIHAACEEGDVLMAQRLQTVLRKYVIGPSYLPAAGRQGIVSQNGAARLAALSKRLAACGSRRGWLKAALSPDPTGETFSRRDF